LVTTTAPAASIEDLVENTTYLVRWRSHPRPPATTKGAAADVGPVWGWGTHSASVTVATPRSPGDAVARRVRRRQGTQPSPHSVEIDWEWCRNLTSGPKTTRGVDRNVSATVVVGVRFGKWWPAVSTLSPVEGNGEEDGGATDGWTWTAVASHRSHAAPIESDSVAVHATVDGSGAVISGLEPGRSYLVTVAAAGEGAPLSPRHTRPGTIADPVRLRTAPATTSGTRFTEMYRVSE
jgi:hypothetical protein